MVDELAIKTGTIAECVERYADVPVEAQPTVETIAVAGATRADAFRVRSTLTVEPDHGAWRVGIRSGGDIVTMSDCPALADSTRRAVSRFEVALEQASIPRDVCFAAVRVAAPVHGHGYVEVEAEAHPKLHDLFSALDASLPDGFGVAFVDSRSGEREHLRGPARFRLPLADLRLEVGFGDWFHATLAPAEVLYDAVSDWLDVSPGERILDAGCGIGTIGLVCASNGATVTGFDSNPLSVETTELNAMANELAVRFECAGWERAFRDFALADETFETVVINPMRQPLGRRALAYVPKLEARRVLYLGPSPASASKDLGILRELGYTIERLGAANLHPATYHVMLVGLLTR